MASGAEDVWLKDAVVFLFAAGLMVPLVRLVRVPAVLGFLIAGVLFGPYGMGAVSDRWPMLEVLTISEPEAAAPFAELGVLFLLFLLGMQLSFERLWKLRRIVLGAGGLQAGASAASISLGLYLAGLASVAAVAIGLALALSSTAIVMQMLSEEQRAAGPVGRAALAVLLFQDMLVAPILLVIGLLAMGDGSSLGSTLLQAFLQGALAIAAIFVTGKLLLRNAFGLAARAGGRDFLMALTLLAVVGAALITASAGLSLGLGAFLIGILLGETEFKHQTEVDLEPFKGILLGLFFMTVGMGLDLPGVWDFLPVVLGGLIALVLVKGAIAAAACRLFAGGSGLAIEVAFLLAPVGEFAFVVISTAAAGGLIGPTAATVAAAIAGLSMLAAPGLARAGRGVARRFAPAETAAGLDDLSGGKGHVVIAGFGRVGRAIARVLKAEEAEIVALDRSPALVERQRRNGWKVYLGDASRPEILDRAGALGASIFLVTVDDPADAEAMVRAIRLLRRDAPVLVRARDADHARLLLEAGASFVISDAVEAGLQLAGRALEEFGYAGETVRDRIAVERDAEYRRATAG